MKMNQYWVSFTNTCIVVITLGVLRVISILFHYHSFLIDKNLATIESCIPSLYFPAVLVMKSLPCLQNYHCCSVIVSLFHSIMTICLQMSLLNLLWFLSLNKKLSTQTLPSPIILEDADHIVRIIMKIILTFCTGCEMGYLEHAENSNIMVYVVYSRGV